jgi:hypothetical protein
MREMSVRISDEVAISVLRHLSGRRVEMSPEASAWIIQVRNRQGDGDPLTILEHSALVYILRCRVLEHPDFAPLHQAAMTALAGSWLHLTRKRAESSFLTHRLPWSVLRKASREERVFHAAALQRDGPTATRSKEVVGQDYIPEVSDWIIATGFLVVALTGIGGAVLGSLISGYAIASVAEYSMHRWGGHEAGGPIKPFLNRAGWLGARISAYLHATYWGHFVVHHVKTCNRNYTGQFSLNSPGDRTMIDAELAYMGRVGRYIKKTNYGMTLGHEGVIPGLLATLPLNVLLWWMLSLDPISGIALITPSFLYLGASKVLHPYLHKSRDKALEQAGPVMRWLLSTRYAEWISRAHWVHHKGGGGNFNLVPGGDLIFGDLRKPSLSMILRMREDRIIGACWD